MTKKDIAVTNMDAKSRKKTTKGAISILRKEGFVPAVVYGNNQDPMPVAIEQKILARFLESPGFTTCLFDLAIDGKKHRVIPRAVQFHPVTDRPEHVDFLRVSEHTRIKIEVPVSFVNAEKSPGIKRGGTLNIVHHTIKILCAPDNIPSKFEVNLEGLQINDAIHMGMVELPEGVKVISRDEHYTIATIAVPSAVRSEKDSAATAAPAAATAAAATPAAAPAAAAAKKPEAKK